MSQPSAQTMTQDQMQAMLAQLLAENAAKDQQIAALAAAKIAKTTLKVSEKGALSVYGMGQFPVSLYREQWEKLLAMKDEIEAFMAQHGDVLADKNDLPAMVAKKTAARTKAQTQGLPWMAKKQVPK